MRTDVTSIGHAPPAWDFHGWVEEQARRSPWWAISVAAHLLLFALGMALTASVRVIPAVEIVTIDLRPPRTDRLRFDRASDFVVREFPRSADVADRPAEGEEILPEWPSTGAVGSADEDFAGFAATRGRGLDLGDAIADRPLKGPGLYDTIGVGGGGGGGGGRGGGFASRLGGKRGAVSRGGGSGRTEDAVLAGLRWLARHQGADGSWDPHGFSDRCAGSICAGRGEEDYRTGVTALSLLAFLGAGYTHETHYEYADGPTGRPMDFGRTVKDGLRWLIRNQDAEGGFGPRRIEKPMYNHAIATLAMAEAYGLTRSPLLSLSARRAAAFLLAARNPRGAWRYTPRSGDSDTSVTGWAVLALKSVAAADLALESGASAELLGLSLPAGAAGTLTDACRAALVDALAFVDGVTERNWGKVGYQHVAQAGMKVFVPGVNDDFAHHEALTAVGLAVRIFAGQNRADPLLDLGARVLASDLPVWDPGHKTIDFYYWYHGTLALYQADGPDSGGSGRYWKAWNKAMVQALVPHQEPESAGCAAGSWSADDRWGRYGGRVCGTALNTLTLEVYYRYPNAFGTARRK